MKKARFTEIQIVSILKQQEGGRTTKELDRENAVTEATIYNWKSKYGVMEASDVKRLKDLEEENSRLKKMYADDLGKEMTQHKNSRWLQRCKSIFVIRIAHVNAAQMKTQTGLFGAFFQKKRTLISLLKIN